MESLLWGWVMAHVTEWAKNSPLVPWLTPANINRIRGVLMLLVAVGTVGLSWQDKTLTLNTVQSNWTMIQHALVMLLGSELTYQATIKAKAPDGK